jgi:hypothetical protein
VTFLVATRLLTVKISIVTRLATRKILKKYLFGKISIATRKVTQLTIRKGSNWKNLSYNSTYNWKISNATQNEKTNLQHNLQIKKKNLSCDSTCRLATTKILVAVRLATGKI